MDDLQAANEKLKEERRRRGLPETGQRIRTISTEIQKIVGDVNKCWKHKDQDKPCPICEEEDKEATKRLMAKVQRQEEERRLEEDRRRQDLFDHPEKAMQGAGVGLRFLGRSFDNFESGGKYVAIARECAETPHDLVLWGISGSGKTHLAVSILREIVRRGGKALYVSVPELMLEIRDSFNPDGHYLRSSEAGIIDKYASVPVLILDDLGAEKTTDYSITTLYLIIDRRYREAMPTIITTNLSPGQIEKELGARIASRLAGMRIGEIKLPDYRKKRA